jgi:hypothetical protein
MRKPAAWTVLWMVFAWMLSVSMMVAAEERKNTDFAKPHRGSDPSKPSFGGFTEADSIETGNLVVQQNACIGNSCSNNGADYSALKLKSTQPNILFEDVAVPEGGPTSSNAWAVLINYLDVDRFSIADITNGVIPFSVAAGAPDDSLSVAGSGKVGIGTATPSEQLHVSGSAGTARALVEETNTTTTPRSLLELRNNGGPYLNFRDTSVSSQLWGIGTSGANLILAEAFSSPQVKLTLTKTGNLIIPGTLTQGSSRSIKTDFVSLDPRDVLARVNSLPVSMWSYKLDGSAIRHVGPMAEDFHQAFGLGTDDKTIAPSDQAGVALLAVQGLSQKVDEKEREIETLRRKNADLEARLVALEALLSARPRE